MELKKFWKIIDSARKDAEGDIEEMYDILVDELSEMKAEEIKGFDDTFWGLMKKSYKADLWAACYIINGSEDEECFDNFRCWLIAQGPKVFDAAIENADSVASVVKPDEDGEFFAEFEDLQFAAPTAYEEKLGEEPEWDLDGHEFVLDKEIWDDEEVIAKDLPKLAKKMKFLA